MIEQCLCHGLVATRESHDERGIAIRLGQFAVRLGKYELLHDAPVAVLGRGDQRCDAIDGVGIMLVLLVDMDPFGLAKCTDHFFMPIAASEKKRRNELKDAQASLCVTGRQKRCNKLNKLKHCSIMIPRDLLGEERAGN